MALSKHSIENLLDLVEIKLGALEIMDSEDRRELRKLELCRDELVAMRTGGKIPSRRQQTPANIAEADHSNVVQLH